MKIIESIKWAVVWRLDRNPEYCLSRLGDWVVFHKWYSVVLDSNWLYKLWITEAILFILRRDSVDLILRSEGSYMATGCGYCGECGG